MLAGLDLNSFEAVEQSVILRLLGEVIKEPETHQIRMHQLPPPPRNSGEWSYAIVFRSGKRPAITPPRTREALRDPLIAGGLARAITPNDNFTFAFTEETIDSYRESKAPTNTDIQKMLGLYLLESLEQVGHLLASHEEHDINSLAEQFGISTDRLIRNVKLLEAMEYIEGPGVSGRSIEDGNFGLTSPLGVTWANGGAQPIVHQQSQNFSFAFSFQFQFNVSIMELHNAIDALDLDPEVTQPVKERIEEFKENPSPETLREFISTASDAVTIGTPIFGTVMTWLSHYPDLINSLFQFRPLGIG